MSATVRESQSTIQTICLLILATVAVTYSVYWLRPVLIPFVVAVFVVSGVTPVLRTLESSLGVSRLVAAGLTFLAGVIVLALFGIAIGASMIELSANKDAYRKRVQELTAQVEQRIPNRLKEMYTPPSKNEGPIEQNSSRDFIPFEKPSGPTSESAGQLVDESVRQGISVISQALVSLVSTSIVVLIYVFFLLIGRTAAFGSETVREVDLQIRSYLALKTTISIFTGFAFGLALRFFGVPMAFTFGVLAFLLNFVPNVGPLVASLLPIPLIILDLTGSLTWMVMTIAVICAIQLISGNLVEPKIMGDSSDLHPVTILLALMFWGMMWGVIGMFLATPIVAAIKIVLQRFDQTRPIADLMAGRWGEDGNRVAAEASA